METVMIRSRPRQAGIALPVMLIMLTVMLIGSIYLLRSSTSTTLTVANLAYDSALSKEADLGVHRAFQWLSTLPSKSALNANSPNDGYVATLDPTWTVSSPVELAAARKTCRPITTGNADPVRDPSHVQDGRPLQRPDHHRKAVRADRTQAPRPTAIRCALGFTHDASPPPSTSRAAASCTT
jgi:hypothetical protein